MSDNILVQSASGKVYFMQRSAVDRQGADGNGRTAGNDAGAAGDDDAKKSSLDVDDIVDVGIGLRLADDIRHETDPEKIKEKLEAGRRAIDENMSRFSSLFGTSDSSVGGFQSILSFFTSLGARQAGSDGRTSPAQDPRPAGAISRLISTMLGFGARP